MEKKKKENKKRNLNIAKKKKENKKKDFKPIVIYGLSTIFVGVLCGLFMPMKYILKYSSFLSFIIPASLYIIIYKNILKKDFKRLTKKEAKKILIFYIITFIVNFIGTNIIKYFNISIQNQTNVELEVLSYPTINFISLVILAPFIEEIVFRYSLGTIIKNKYLFIIISSLLFGIVHTTGSGLFIYVAIGCIFSTAYCKTNKNIWVPIAIHTINNLVGFIEILLNL